LSSGESYDLVCGVIAVACVEVVEVPARGA